MTISFMEKQNNYSKIFIFPIYYLVFLLAFLINENSTGGALQDYQGYRGLIDLFIKDFTGTFLSFDQFNERHSPLIIILLSYLYKLELSDTLIRFIFFNFSIISIIFFYKCLVIKFKKVPSNYLFLLSLVFFISPVFRSLSVWPDSRIIGFHFFTISVFYYLKYFNNEKKMINCYLNVFFLAVSSYFSINFCLFGIFFFYKFYKDLLKNKKILNYLLLNIILAFPAFYYLFILDVFFINTGLTPGNENNSLGIKNNLNISNKILIISSIIFFYFIPFFFYFKKYFFLKQINLKETSILLLLTLVNIYLFNYQLFFTGGGIFFKVSNLIFDTNLLFFIISTYSIFFLYVLFIKTKSMDNIIILIIIILSNPQLSIYHKYYDPLLLFLIFTIFNLKFAKKYFSIKNIGILNLFYLTFLMFNFVK